MEQIKIFLFLFALLAPSAIILAQESTQAPSAASSSQSPEENPPLASGAAGTFGHFFPFNFDFGQFSLPSFPGSDLFSGSRKKRSSEPADLEHAIQDRNFFGRYITCNFTQDGLTSCTDCNTVRRCYPFNVGSVTKCWGLFPYCRNGFCSTKPGELCDASTTNSTPTSANNSTNADNSTTTTEASSG